MPTRLSSGDLFRLQQAQEYAGARNYNQNVADSYSAGAQDFAPTARGAQELLQGFVPWMHQGALREPTFGQQAPDVALASLQNDNRFKGLSDDLQETVLRARGGEEAVRRYKLAQTISVLGQKAKADAIVDLEKRKMDFQLAPITRIKDMLGRGDLRVSPKGHGFEIKEKNLAGIEEWKPADPYLARDAVRAWGVLYPGETPPENPALLKRLSALGAVQSEGKNVPVYSPSGQGTPQQKATAYNQQVANLQTQAPGVGAAQGFKNWLQENVTGRAPAGYGLPGQSMGGAAVLDTATRLLSMGSNAITGARNAARAGANFINEFAPYQTTPYESIPQTTPEEIQKYFYNMGSNAAPRSVETPPDWLVGQPGTPFRNQFEEAQRNRNR